jgi:hypothetical protein
MGDHLVGPTCTGASATTRAAAHAPVVAVPRAAAAGTPLDAATENAFAVASRSVVYIDNVGVGSGSGVI